MDVHFVKDVEGIITYCSHPEKPHIFYLFYNSISKELLVFEEDLLNHSIVNRFSVPREGSKIKDTHGYNLTFYRKKNFLVLSTPSSYLIVWETVNKVMLLRTLTRGKEVYNISIMAFSENNPTLFFAATGKRNLYAVNINDAIMANNFINYKKMRIPKKVSILDLSPHPFDTILAVACSDGQIKIWDTISFNYYLGAADPRDKLNKGKSAPAPPGMNCVAFFHDGSKILSSNEEGIIYCWDARNLSKTCPLIATLKISEAGIVSISAINYNGELISNKCVCYTSEGAVKLLELQILSKQKDGKDKASPVGKFIELESLYQIKGETRLSNLKQYNLGFSKFLQGHPIANILCFNSVKMKLAPSSSSESIQFVFSLKILMLHDKLLANIGYPIVSDSYQYSIDELIPNSENKIILQDQLMFAEDLEIRLLSLSDSNKKVACSLKNLFTDDFRLLSIEQRPLNTELVEKYYILLTYLMENIKYAMIFSRSVADFQKQLDLFKNYPCVLSFFLGREHLKEPPILLLHEDRSKISIILDDESENLGEIPQAFHNQSVNHLNLNVKIQNIFWTPLREGYAVLYQTYHDNLLRYSKNMIETNEINDYGILNNGLAFKSDYDESILEVTWQKKSPAGCGNYIASVICWTKIYFLDQNLKQISRSLKLGLPFSQANPISQAKWFGPTLIFSSKTQFYYTTISGTYGALLSLDKFNNKNKLGAVLNDRFVLFSKHSIHKQRQKHQSTLEVKFRSFNCLEVLLLGYLSYKEVFEEFELNRDIIRKLILMFESNQISPQLIESLNKHKLFNCSWFFLKNENNIQFPATMRLEVANKLLKFNQTLDLLFPHKDLSDAGSVFDIAKGIDLHPMYQQTKKLIAEQIEYLLSVGQYSQAIKCLDLLGKYQRIATILQGLGENDKLNEYVAYFAELVSGTNLSDENFFSLQTDKSKPNIIGKFPLRESTVPAGLKVVDRDFGKIKASLQNPVAKLLDAIEKDGFNNMQKLAVNFGEKAYTLTHKFRDPATGEIAEKAFETLSLNTISQFLGYDSVISDSHSKKPGKSNERSNADELEHNFGDEEETAETQGLLIYWRFDEGKGLSIEDLSDCDNPGTVELKDQSIGNDFWTMLDDGDPMELEDKWGKKCPIQYSIAIQGGGVIVKNSKRNWHQEILRSITMEFWIKPHGKSGTIMEIGESNFAISLNNLKIDILVKKSSIPLKEEENQEDSSMDARLDQEEEGGQKKESDNNKRIKENFWNHVSVVYDKSQDKKKLVVMLNCVPILFSEHDLSEDLFKDTLIHIGREHFSGEITELRVWKTAFSDSEIKDNYRTPLEIVAEKKKQIKMKLKKDKPVAGTENDLKKFTGFLAMPGSKAENPIKGPPKLSFPTFGNPTTIKFPQKGQDKDEDQEEQKVNQKEERVSAETNDKPQADFNNFSSTGQGFSNHFASSSDIQDSQFNPVTVSVFNTKQLAANNQSTEFTKQGSSNPPENDFGGWGGFDQKKDSPKQKTDGPKSDWFGSANAFNTATSDMTKDFSTTGSNFADFGNFSSNVKKVESADQGTANNLSSSGNWGNFGSFDSSKTNTAFDQNKGISGFDSNKQSTGFNDQKMTTGFDQKVLNSFDSSKPFENTQKAIAFDNLKTSSTFDQIKATSSFDGFSNPTASSFGASNEINSFGSQASTFGGDKGFASGFSSFSTSSYPLNSEQTGPVTQMNQLPNAPKDKDIGLSSSNDPTLPKKKKIFEENQSQNQSQNLNPNPNPSPLIDPETEKKLKEISSVVETCYSLMEKEDLQNSIVAVHKAFELLKAVDFKNDTELASKIQRVIMGCGVYRFALQMLIAIKQMKTQNNLKKECFLYLVLIHLNLNPTHRITFIIDGIKRNMEAKNYAVAESLLNAMLPNLTKVNVSEDQRNSIKDLQQQLEKLPEKVNESLLPMNCPSCCKPFNFKGVKICSRCNEAFLLCYQTLSCLKKEQALICEACKSIFSTQVRKEGEKCSICKIRNLEKMS